MIGANDIWVGDIQTCDVRAIKVWGLALVRAPCQALVRTSVIAAFLSLVTTAQAATPDAHVAATSSGSDPRIRSVVYAPDAVVSIRVRRGQVTHIVLAPDEVIEGVPASGQGANCVAPVDTWCVVAGEGRDLFVKPLSQATVNNLVVVSNKRRHVFELVPTDKGVAAMRVSMVAPPSPAKVQAKAQPKSAASEVGMPSSGMPSPGLPSSVQPNNLVEAFAPPLAATAAPPPMTSEQLLANRLRAVPQVRNAAYSVAVGQHGAEIVPAMVWDDGRFTYFTFAGNRPVPAVFQTSADGAEEMVNLRAGEDGLLVADRVARRFVLRLGQAVVAIINEAFDPQGASPVGATAVPGVVRVLRDGPSRASLEGERP